MQRARLLPLSDDDFVALLSPTLEGWRMAGKGGFFWTDDGALESRGGSGLLWYAEAVFDDFVARVDWRVSAPEDNSGIFLRTPPLTRDDIGPAIERGYEIQIDERGVDPASGTLGSALHLTGAVYKLAPATARASRPIGEWNRFEIHARGDTIAVALNGTAVARLDDGARGTRGHLALQAHHDGSRVQFRDLLVKRL
jgi:hypothetical protein